MNITEVITCICLVSLVVLEIKFNRVTNNLLEEMAEAVDRHKKAIQILRNLIKDMIDEDDCK